REAHQHVFDRRGTLVLGGKDLRMIGIECEAGLARLLLAEAVKAFDRRVAVRAVLPFAGGAPFELRRFRGVCESFARIEQCSHIHAVINSAITCHGQLPALTPDTRGISRSAYREGEGAGRAIGAATPGRDSTAQ